jgi:hypothetical protein
VIERLLEEKEAKSRPPRYSALKVAAFVIGIPGVLAAVWTFLPRMNVSVSDPVDPSDPFSASISVVNTGNIPLYNVHVGIPVIDISSLTGGGVVGDREYGTVLFPDAGKAGDLWLDDKFSFPLNKVMDGDKDNLKTADIGILIQYDLPIIGLRRYRVFPAHVQQQGNGNFYWYVQPLSKSYSFVAGYRMSGPIHFPHVMKKAN